MQIFISRIAHANNWDHDGIVTAPIAEGLLKADAVAYTKFLFADKSDPPGDPLNPVEEGILTQSQWDKLDLKDIQNKLRDRWVLNFEYVN